MFADSCFYLEFFCELLVFKRRREWEGGDTILATSSPVPGFRIAEGVFISSSLHRCIEVLNSELRGSVNTCAFFDREFCSSRAVAMAVCVVRDIFVFLFCVFCLKEMLFLFCGLVVVGLSSY